MLELKTELLAFLGQMGAEEIMALLAVALLMLILLMFKIYRRKAAERAEQDSVPVVQARNAAKPAPQAARVEPVRASERVTPPVSEAKPQAAAPAGQTSAEQPIPEDSVLHRHYLANKEAEHLAITEPYPTDSVLHRHYDSIHCYHADKSAGAVTAGNSNPCPVCSNNLALPQDSVLRRHFLTQLRAEVEASLSPVPSDSVLRRHYQALVTAEMDKRVAALAG